MMENIFEISVIYKNKELVFSAEVIRYGYVHRIKVDVEGQIIFLEKDEEGNYRGIADTLNIKELNKNLIQAIVTSIEAMLE